VSDIEVRIVRLDPMRVASAQGFGESPEGIAWEKILKFADAKGIDRESARFFGFDNPVPSPGSPNYGYEQWITVGPDVEPEGDIRIIDFTGGLYAVTRCKLPRIGEAWKQLVIWREDSKYRRAHHQSLEEGLSPYGTAFEDIVMDIYLPIAE
jgi:DNA gyrase inhibitor GyrI